ncbi:MAG: hypothetical protein WA667_18995 [Candidatus Nitrosopolaris sp.]
MKRTSVIVDVDDLEKLQKDIGRLKRNKRAEITTKDRKKAYEEYDFTEKEKRIREYIKNNPGTSKQGVVDNFKGTCSRGPILNTINQMEKEGIILVREDEHNSQVHHLFINNENLLVSLIEELDSFKQRFFNLIDKAMTIGGKEENNDDWLARLQLKWELMGALLFPYKHFIIKYNLGDLFLPRDTNIDDETLHRKFTIVFDVMQEIHAKLYQITCDKRWIDNNEELKEQLLDSIILEGSNYEELGNVLKIFERHGLRQSAEAVFDSLFGNREWLRLIPEFPISAWRKEVVQFALGLAGSP